MLKSLCRGSGACRGRGYSWLPAGVWPKWPLVFGRAVIFSKGCSRAAGLRSAQLPGGSASSAGGPAMHIGTPLPTASLGCPTKSAQNMAEILKPDVLPLPWLQRKGKGLGLCRGWGRQHLLRVGRLPVRVALAGVQDLALGCSPHSPPVPPRAGCKSRGTGTAHPGRLWRWRKPHLA